MNLYEIDQAYRDVLARAEEYAEEHAGEILPDLADALDLISDERNKKIENYLKYYKNESAKAEMVTAELSALEKRRKQHEANAQLIKEILASVVGAGNKLEFGCGKIGWRSSHGIEIVDAQKLPETCFVVKRELSKTMVKNEIENGIIPPEIAYIYTKQNISIK